MFLFFGMGFVQAAPMPRESITRDISVATENYELTINLKMILMFKDEYWAKIDFQILNKSAQLLRFDPTKVFLVDEKNHQLGTESPNLIETTSLIRDAERILGTPPERRIANRKMDEDIAKNSATELEIAPLGKMHKTVTRYHKGDLPRTLSLSIFGLHLGETAIEVPLQHFTLREDN